MTDISSIRNSSKKGKIQENFISDGKYISLRKQYTSFIKKMEKSDFANSPVLKQKELEFLELMQAAAIKEGLQDEITFIEERKSALLQDEKQEKTISPQSYYNDISCNTKRTKESDFSKIIEICQNSGGKVLQDRVDSVKILAQSGIDFDYIPRIINELSEQNAQTDTNSEIKDNVILDLCTKIANCKSMGTKNTEAVSLVKFCYDNCENSEKAYSSILKLLNSKISPDAAIKILKNLSVSNQDNKKKVLSSEVNSVISLKKSLVLNRKNEEKERNNPINNLSVSVFNLGDSLMIKNKDDCKIVPIADNKENLNKDINELKKRYEQAVSQIEDDILVEFTSKYKNENGEINKDGLRTITALRRAGVSYEQLFPLTEFCIDKGIVNPEKISAVSKLKKSGCLGSDIIEVLNSVNNTPDGKYDSEDLKNACEFTSLIIDGKDVSSLVSQVHGNKTAKDFLVSMSEYFNDNSNLVKLLPLIKNEENTFDENAMEILYNLADNFFSPKYNMKEEDFLKYADDIIKTAKGTETNVSDAGAGVCSIMCQNEHSPEEILKGLEICKDKRGIVETETADVLWEMCLLNADIAQITKFINSVCKDKYGNPNHIRARKAVENIRQGKSFDEIMNLVKNYLF